MKVIIAGGRDFNRGDMVIQAVKEFKTIHGPITEIVSGMAKGADYMGWHYARIWDIPCKELPADWNTHGKAAGPIRNRQMAEYADALIAFWDGKSVGTKNMIDTMNNMKKLVMIVRY